MKKCIKFYLIFTVVAVIIGAGCATTKTTTSKYVGNWNYIVKNLPEGDIRGTMVLSQDGENFSGNLMSDDGSISLKMEDLKIENDNLSSYFYFQGMKIYMDGVFNGDNFSGKVSVDYNKFPVTAQKVE